MIRTVRSYGAPVYGVNSGPFCNGSGHAMLFRTIDAICLML
jgi:hypothetical protein